VKAMGVSWQVALGAVFLFRRRLSCSHLGRGAAAHRLGHPIELHARGGRHRPVSGADWFRNSGIIVPNPPPPFRSGTCTMRTRCSDLRPPGHRHPDDAWHSRRHTRRNTHTTVLAVGTGLARWEPQAFSIADIGATAFQLDLKTAASPAMLEVAFVFLFVSLFDNIGTLVGVTKVAGLIDDHNEIPRITAF